MYTVQIRWIEKQNGQNRKLYLKRTYSNRKSVVNWIYQMADKPQAKHIYITAWDSGDDIIYYQHDDDVEMYDSRGNPVESLDSIGR